MEKRFQEFINHLPKELLPYKKEIEATKQIYIPIELEKAKNISLATSKVGGYPYLPMNMEYPIGKNGKILDFLAQINFSEMPSLKDYPTHGILQFYIDFPMGSNTKVIYHETIEQSYQTQFPKLEKIRQDEEYLSPIYNNSEYKMIFCSPEYEVVGYADFRFKEINVPSDIYEFSSYEHKVGGYAYFAQEDPRDFYGNPFATEKDPQEDNHLSTHLLFQLNSDEEDIAWGDVGVGNFFIQPQDLKNRDFSKVLFHWDCY